MQNRSRPPDPHDRDLARCANAGEDDLLRSQSVDGRDIWRRSGSALNHVSPGRTLRSARVLREDLSAELTGSGKFKVVASGKGDAEVRIRVREYGFAQALGFMRRSVKPILTIETTMVRADGVQIWQSGVVVNQAEKKTPTVLPEQLSDRAVAVDALHTAAKIWAAKTAASLK